MKLVLLSKTITISIPLAFIMCGIGIWATFSIIFNCFLLKPTFITHAFIISSIISFIVIFLKSWFTAFFIVGIVSCGGVLMSHLFNQLLLLWFAVELLMQ
ncbi:hypothetical protein Bcsk_003640 [Bartonella sp. CDC_skunk]|uniref:Uncharacterized protein n=1 Tax=Bartonella rochalimae ATCC BAA-1498 TaxID=685782 RepID=A0A067W936_9HYPH|nr:hypothetical protein BA1379B_002460 [Bartonella sp. A1379B]AQX21024.1 hypothetical protein Bcsk_003640 [Bartonella sp. CDC_skunk]AQX22607.1 hypothetical protein Bho11B_005850 [Bartonella sp. 11B]AQX24110.1 hypothetical protein Bho114_007910 [Bartonella sp. 114]AQX25056.1 hypothetical protein Bco22_003590 [Bartonella sp. Coyote22sub2]AQX26282.1 hypothetical protein Bra60_002600 [Bartonella sp. Raccoon60]ATO57040.1 hypothetical protein B11Cv2_002560 [Bartonella sp. 1-1C]KEC56500.1 hypotheti